MLDVSNTHYFVYLYCTASRMNDKLRNKMKKKKNTTVPKSHRKIVERDKIYYLNIQMQGRTGLVRQFNGSGGVKLFIWAQASPLSEMM